MKFVVTSVLPNSLPSACPTFVFCASVSSSVCTRIVSAPIFVTLAGAPGTTAPTASCARDS